MFSWTNAENQTLSNINSSVNGNKLVMVVGEVGSGKVALLYKRSNRISNVFNFKLT